MATDSTNLPLGETNVDAGTDMTGSELDLTAVQLAQVEGAQPIELPKGSQVILIPVKPGQVIELPTDSTDGLLAKIGPAPEGNLAIVVDGRTIILQGYVHANEQSPVKVVTNDGDTVDVADVVAATDPTLDIQTAAGPATNPGDTTPDSSGIFVPFGPGADLGGLHAAGILDPTALQYKLIDDDRKEFDLEEDTGPTSIDITFDILGGVINEDDLEGAQIIDQPENEFAAKLVFKSGGNDGVGNDPFDDDGDVNDKAGNTSPDGVPDSDLEPLVTVATVKVNFNGDVPGKLVIDDSVLPSGLTSDGQLIVYDVVPVLGHGNGIVGFIDNGGTPGEFDKGTDRLVFTVLVDEPASNSEFHVIFTLYDNIDNEAPDQNGDGAADLLGANEQTLDLPVKITAIDSDGTPLSTVMHLGVIDDIPFFGQAVDVGEGERLIQIIPGDADITHDESKGVDGDADDQSKADAGSYAHDATQAVLDAGFSLPYGDSVGAIHPKGIAQTQVLASFGADQASTEFDEKGESDPTARNSIFGELEDRTDADGDGLNDGENEHPFELFMIATGGAGPDATPSEDNLKTAGNEGNLTIEDQLTNAYVTWDGDQILQVSLHQIDAHTIVGYVIPEGEVAPAAEAPEALVATGQEAVFVLTIDDNGVMTFVQYHQINHDKDGVGGGDPDLHDDPFQILGADGTPIIQVRISDHDGDHATQPVKLTVEDDGPKFIKVCYDQNGGVVDEDELPAGNHDVQPGDNVGGTSTSGQILFAIGVDKPGALSIGDVTIRDSTGNVLAVIHSDDSIDGVLQTADGHDVEVSRSVDPGTGIITLVGKDGSDLTDVFTFTIDSTSPGMGNFTFTLQQALAHPDSNNDNSDDATDSGKGAYEDDLNFDFGIIATDVDGDTANGHVIIKVDDDVPVFECVDFGHDHDSDGGVGLVDEDKLPAGNQGFDFGPGDNSLLDGTFTDGTINFKFGADQPGTLAFGDLKITDSAGNTIDISALKTADGHNVHLVQSGPDGNGVVTLQGVEDGTGDPVFTLTMDGSGADIGDFKFTLNQALSHPFTDSDLNNDDVPQSRFEDDLKFDFTVIATDADGDAAQGHIKVVVDDDSPKAVDDFDLVTEGKDKGGDWNVATGNVVTGADAVLLGKDSNGFPLDGTPDLPGADRPYTISKLAHDGHTYTLSADGTTVLKDGGALSAGESFDGHVLKIGTHEGGTLEIVMISNTQSEVGEYRYTVPADADHDVDVTVGPETPLESQTFGNLADWTSAFHNGGVDVSAIGGSLVIKNPVDVNPKGGGIGAEDYSGIGVSSGQGDEPEVDRSGQGGTEGLRLELSNATFPGGVTNATLTIGALFDGVQYDAGNQEILKWEIWNNGSLVGSGQILGDNDGLVTLDIDTGGQKFDEIRLYPVNNGAGGANNSDFLLLNVDICKPLDKFTENFDYTLRDADGDESTATLHVGVLDTAPKTDEHHDVSLSFTVDEDGLPVVGIGDHQSKDAEENHSAPNAPVDDAKHIGNIPFTPGFDPVTIELTVGNGGDTGLDTVDGKNVLAAWDAATGTLVGYIEGTDPSNAPNQVFKMTITDAQSGAFTFTLLQPLEHPNVDSGKFPNDNTENDKDLSFLIDVQIEDKDCDVATTQIKVTIDDDMPVITQISSSISLNVDETLGGNGTDYDDPAYPGAPQDGSTIENDEALTVLPGALTNPVYGTVIGADTANGASLFSFNPGADGLQSALYSLTITGGGVTGLTDTATGLGIILVQNGSVIEGRAVDGNGATPDPVVFAFTINSATGEVSMAQYRAIDHGDEEGEFGAPDEVATMLSGKLAVTLAVTDKDGDTASSSKDISGSITFDDDGPVVTHGSGTLSLALDETVSKSGSDYDDPNFANDGIHDGNAIEGDENFVTLPGSFAGYGSAIGAASGSTVGLFSVNPGTDGLASIHYNLNIDNANTGLTDTATGTPVTLSWNFGVIEGRDGSGHLVLAIQIDQNTGQVTVAQYRAVDHGDEEIAPGAHDEVTFLNDHVLSVTAIATDKDGDSDSESVDISHAVSFDDDGPTALNDFDCLTEGEGNIATGNVVTGVDGLLLGQDANVAPLDGTADNPGVDGPYTVSKLVHDGHTYELSADGLTVTKDSGPLGAGESFVGGVLKIGTELGGTFEIVMKSATQSEVGEYRYTGGEPPHHGGETFAGPADTAASRSAAFDTLGEWQSSFATAGITVSGIGGSVVLKSVDVAGPDDYRGLGVSSGNGDEPEVDNAGPDESMQLDFASLTNNTKLTLGAFFDGHQFDAGNQEVLLWQVFNGAVLVASGQILGSDNGLVTLDIDTGGSQFNRIVLTPLDNGAGSTSANNSDFLLLNVEACSPNDKVSEQFDYTLRDGDGDESSATLTIGIKDTQPTIPVQTSGGLSILIDEDGLNPSGTIKDGIGDHNTNDAEEDHTGPNAAVDDAKHIGTIPFIAGADPVTIELSVDNKGDTGLNTLTGKNIFAAWDPEEQQLVGYVEGTDPSDAANRIFIMHIDGQSPGAFNYTFTLLQPIQHADGGQDDNTENNPDPYFNIGIQIEDKDCDVAYTTLKVTIDDDMPVVQISADSNGTTQHDETAGRQTDTGDDDQSGSVPALFNVVGLPPVGNAIGWAHDGDSVVNLTGAHYGADGPGTTAYALHIPADGTDSGVDTTDGHNIWLYQGPNGIIVGREGDATNVPNPAGAIIFAVSIDSDGELTVVQYDSLKHPTFPNEYDEDIGLNTNALQAVVTLTDADGDSANGSANIGNLVRFDDDGPKAKIEATSANVQHDETAGVQNPGDGDMDQAAVLPANLVAVGTLIGWAKSNAAVVSTAASSFGADDEGATSVLSLKVSSAGVNSDLDITTGESIFLYKEGDVVVGRVGSGIGGNTPNPAGNVAFVVSVDTDGKLNVAQYLSIHHDNTGSFDETAMIKDSALQVVVTVTDGDGDIATDSVSIGNHVRFDDDGPTANPDVDSVKEDAAENYASGNVVTAVDGGLATDTNLTDGVKDSGGADGIKAHSVQWADPAAPGGIDSNGNIVGQYGTLFVDDAGNYKYVLDNTNIDVNKLNDGEHLTETFTYYVKDGDDDKTSSTLKITIDGHTDAFPPEARDATATVDEDGIPVLGNQDSAPGDDNADLPPDTATPDEHVFHATLPVNWNSNPGTITLAAGDLSALRTIDNHTINVTGTGTGLLTGLDAVTNEVVFTVQILNATTGEYQVTLSKPLLHPDSDNNHANDGADFGLGGYEDNLTIPVNVTYTNIGGTVTKALSIDVDDDMPFVAPTTSGTISLAVDETLGNVGDDPHNPGFTPENDETLFPLLPAQLTGLGTLIGAAQDSAAGLFTSSAGADGEFDHSYELTVTNGGATGLTDTATGLAINLVKVGDVVQGQVGVGPNIAFAFYIDEATGQVSMAQYRAIVHTDPTNPDDVRAMIGNQGVLGVTLTVTDNDGDKASVTRDISGAVSFDDDGPKANDDPVNAAPGSTGTADIVFIVDVSGSMTNGGGSIVIPGVPDFSDDRLGLARFSMRELLTNHPEILNVQFIKFDDNLSSPSSVWLTRADALTYIANDANFVGGGATNYDVALQEAINIYGASARPAGAADQTLVYFLSDGAPNTANDPNGDAGITNNGTGNDVSIAEWEAFVGNPANNITNVFAIGLGSANVGNLEPIAYPNDDVNPNDGTEDRVVIIPDSNITALTQTIDDLLTDVITPVSGNVTDNDNPGTDGFGNTELVEVVYGITHYVFDATHHAYDIDLGVGRGSLHIDEHGAYTYTPPSGDVVDGTPFSLQYVIRDGDGDTSTANINIDLNSKPLTDLNGVAGGDDVTVGFIEQTPALIAPDAVIGDDDGTLLSMTVTLTNRPDGNGVESLSPGSLPGGLVASYDSGTGVLSVTGAASVADYQTALRSIVYNNTSDHPDTTSRAVNVVLNDGVNNSVVNVSTITVTPVNDAPDAVAPAGPYAATEQVNLNLHGTGLSISDIDAGGGSMTVTLSVGFGTLTLTAGNSGASIGAGNGTSSVIVTGTVTQINNLLAGTDTGPGSPGTIVYNANSDTPPANTQLTLHLNDNGNTGGGALTDDALVTINITNTPEPPVAVDDHIFTNISDLITVKDGWLLKNDTDADTAHASLVVDSATAGGNSGFFDTQPSHSGTNVTFEIDITGGTSLGNGDSTSFSYVVKDPILADTGSVEVTYDTSGSVNGSSGADILIGLNVGLNGGAGDDQIVGTGTTDLLDFSNINTNWTFTLGAGGSGTATIDGTDTYEGIDGVIGGDGNNTITGNAGNNILNGGAGADTLNGGDGDDILDGGADSDTYAGGKGSDTINVGSGNDTVNYTSTLDGTDVIQNFDGNSSGGQDVFNLDALFDSLGTADGVRAGRVQIVDNGSTVEVNVNADGVGGFELHVATINTNDTVTVGSDVIVV